MRTESMELTGTYNPRVDPSGGDLQDEDDYVNAAVDTVVYLRTAPSGPQKKNRTPSITRSLLPVVICWVLLLMITGLRIHYTSVISVKLKDFEDIKHQLQVSYWPENMRKEIQKLTEDNKYLSETNQKLTAEIQILRANLLNQKEETSKKREPRFDWTTTPMPEARRYYNTRPHPHYDRPHYYYTTQQPYYNRPPSYFTTPRPYYNRPWYYNTTPRPYYNRPWYYNTTPRPSYNRPWYYNTTPRPYYNRPWYYYTTPRPYYNRPWYYNTTPRPYYNRPWYYNTTPRPYYNRPWYYNTTPRPYYNRPWYYNTTPRPYYNRPWYYNTTPRPYYNRPWYYNTTPRPYYNRPWYYNTTPRPYYNRPRYQYTTKHPSYNRPWYYNTTPRPHYYKLYYSQSSPSYFYRRKKRQTEPCPQGWLHYQSSCYMISSWNYSDQKTWDEARDDCRFRGADLVVVGSPEEQDFIYKSSLTGAGTSSYWIGLRVNGSGWKWVNESDLRHSYWLQPPVEKVNCATSVKEANGWKSVSCDDKNGWICQQMAVSS
ncbi:uncharacterized protein LOC118557233 [Fundulus heteroclitus]|uniref:uncharacterized protein LOC118557233 n=1 Tax=Fundulus heteroclitus TaxID=8078 RepID=UPI00165BCFA2|nr:uncharacterized protein LOC118557233 [Fundulus heteroclitus]